MKSLCWVRLGYRLYVWLLDFLVACLFNVDRKLCILLIKLAISILPVGLKLLEPSVPRFCRVGVW
jgi:hypothetical protein